MIDGAAGMSDGAFEKTIYTGGFSAASKTYYYNTYDDPAIRAVRMDDYELDSESIFEETFLEGSPHNNSTSAGLKYVGFTST